MDRKSVVLKYFQKAESLSTKNPNYCRTISSLFQWLTTNDQVKNDLSSKFFFQRKTLAGSGKIITHDDIIIAGLDEIAFLLNKYTQLSIAIYIKDGQKAKKEEILAEISGNIYQILAYERTILNILQRMSGIASETKKLISLIKKVRPSSRNERSQVQSCAWRSELFSRAQARYHSAPGEARQGRTFQDNLPFLAATRKTPWGLLDKKAVAVGGGLTHRLNLSDGILIKDNHLSTIRKQYQLETMEEAIEKALEEILLKKAVSAKVTSEVCEVLPRGGGIKDDLPKVEESRELIEIEVESEKQAYQAIKTFQQSQQFNHSSHLAILLDNFSPSQIRSSLSILSSLSLPAQAGNLARLTIFEASGGINEENIQEFAQTGVDIISLGSLTHSSQAANLSLEIS